MKKISKAGLALFFIIVVLSGCITGSTKPPAPAPVVITPCNTANTGIQLRIKASTLDNKSASIIKPELEIAFVDNFKSQAAADMRKNYILKCYWGAKIGQRRDYYYCDGKYRAPDLDENQIIRRYIMKTFTIGFSVEEHNVGKWTDSSGKVHDEGSIYYLMTKTVDSKCTLS
jgi:hypothetical protein